LHIKTEITSIDGAPYKMPVTQIQRVLLRGR